MGNCTDVVLVTGASTNSKPNAAPGRPADLEKRKSLGIEIPTSPVSLGRKKSGSANNTPTRGAHKRSLSIKNLVGLGFQ